MSRARLEPAAPFMRHPLRPHQLVERITPTEDAIVLCHLGVPRLSADDWSVTVDGLVGRPLRLTYDDLVQRPRAEIAAVHQCCGSPLQPETPMRRICNVVWGGASLSALIAECRPEPAARFVWSYGADHGVFGGVACDSFVKDLPLDRVAADVLIAYEMNGAPLTPEHGYPARLVVPGYYGTNSVKWLSRLTLAKRRATGPFTTRWYNDPIRDARGEPTGQTTPVWSIAPESVIASPSPDQVLVIGEPTEVWGWAWADGGVGKVEIGIGGETIRATALESPNGHAWQRFAGTCRPVRAGRHELWSRATAINGLYQPPAGARNAIHCVPVEVVPQRKDP